MKAAVIGASGQIGGWLIHFLRLQGIEALGTYATVAYPGLDRLDSSHHQESRDWIIAHRPSIVFYPAGWTWVDGCEKDPPRAEAANVADPLNIALAGHEIGATFVYYSTDYVFDGTSGPNTETDHAHPLSVYGLVKLEAEKRLAEALGDRFLCLRTAWVQGPERQGKNFAYQVWRNLSQGKPMVCPTDQVSNPTYGPDLAKISVEMALDGRSGLWNAAGPDLLARDELGRRIASSLGFDPALIVGKTTAELAQPAARPLRGGLDSTRLRAHYPNAIRPLDQWLEDFRDLCRRSLQQPELPLTPPERL
jgi:dTDP-4-dehydrorhamnose reductase